MVRFRSLLFMALVVVLVGVIFLSMWYFREREADLGEIRWRVQQLRGDWVSLMGDTKSLYVSSQSLSDTFDQWKSRRESITREAGDLSREVPDLCGNDPGILQTMDSLLEAMRPGEELTGEFMNVFQSFLDSPEGQELNRSRTPVSDFFAYQATRGNIDNTWVAMQRIKALVKVIDVFNTGFMESHKSLADIVEMRIREIRRTYLGVQTGLVALALGVMVALIFLLGRLNASLNQMVEARTRSLDESLHRLKDTQEVLLEVRRQAATTSLIVGLAHEMNTPLGVVVTASSALRAWTGEFRNRMEGGVLTHGMTREFLRNVDEACRLMDSNLDRVHANLSAFRGLAVDLGSFHFENLEMEAFVVQVLESPSLRARNSGLELVLHCDPGLRLHTSPEALGRCLEALVSNALDHGFPQGKSGIVEVVIHRGTTVDVTVKDDGIGTGERDSRSLMEPFFTTARNQGHMGLGLNMVHNIVTLVLGGTMEILPLRTGFSVTMHLPADGSAALRHRPGAEASP